MKITGALPKGDLNGLDGLDYTAAGQPDLRHVVIAVIKPKRVVTDSESGTTEVLMKIVRVERVLGTDAPTAEKLLRRALERRTGQATLPLELEGELTAIFDDANTAAPWEIEPNTLDIDGTDDDEEK